MRRLLQGDVRLVGVRYHHAEAPGRPKTISTLDVTLTIRPVTDHPICEGIDAFDLVDEAYRGLETVSPITPLFETDHPASDGPVAWIGPRTKNRTVVLEPGHTAGAFRHPTYCEVIRRSLAWVVRADGSPAGHASRRRG